MIVHLHASCWNEERMLPFFFRHYDALADRYFIYDNQSTDRSISILSSHPKVTVLPFVLDGESLVESSITQMNQVWKQSRGQADWVGVCNIDELFWHIDILWYLRQCRRRGITFLGSIGYQMVSERFPDFGENLPKSYRFGVRDRGFDKPSFFNPDAIEASGFSAGRHRYDPTGHVKRAEVDEILLLHYKYIGFDYVLKRHAELNSRRRALDVKRRYGHHYGPAQTEEAFKKLFAAGNEVVPGQQNIMARMRRRWLGRSVCAAERAA